MEAKDIRKEFLKFFEDRNHPVIPSSSLIPHGDPTLLFTSAGMVQFKPYFLGLKTDLKRAASCQKCFRTTDIDNVGKTIRHLTFFEMLGNFSFGDYFKEESIKWGWEFLTEVCKIPVEKLHVSVYSGGIAPKDEETEKIWKKILPKKLHSHIHYLGDDSNFWSMGDTGPSGPCSEIYYDRGEIFHKDCKGPECGCDRFIEVWNHVFTQFDRQPDGSFKPLPQKNIDTGMGLERLSFILENKYSPFETTLFFPVIHGYYETNKKDILEKFIKEFERYFDSCDNIEKYNQFLNDDLFFELVSSMRIISDHVRGASFLISEGILPSNEGRGYVLRRLVRRALRYSMLLGVKKPNLYKLVKFVEEIFADAYPQITENRKHIEEVLKYEEKGFLDTLEVGERYLSEVLERGSITGFDAFKIYETYGFPFELIREIASKRGIDVNEAEFYKAKEKAQEVSRSAWKSSGEEDLSVFQKINDKLPKTEFTGYDSFVFESKLIAIIDKKGNILKKADYGEFYLVFDKTPFYAESGGQVADTGKILSGNEVVAEVVDVIKPFNDVFYHKAKITGEIKVDGIYRLEIDAYRRKKIMSNHTATHLINAALKKVFGPTTVQAGSLVNEEKFRFDYTITRTPSLEELKKVEEIANNAILEGYKVYKEVRPLSDAKKLGATILVGEKYEDPARFVLINHKGFSDTSDKYSLELCGGTHVDDLKEVFRIKIVRESSVSRGIRRIEGVSGYSLIEYYEKESQMLDAVAETLDTNKEDIINKINRLNSEIKKLKSDLMKINSTANLKDEIIDFGSDKLVLVKIPLGDVKIIRNIADKKRSEYSGNYVFVYALNGNKLSFVLTVDKKSGKSIKSVFDKISDKLNLKAGGRDDFMQGGGSVESEEKLKSEIRELFK